MNSFSQTVCLTSGRYNVMAWGWRNNISLELDGFLLLECLSERGVGCAQWQLAEEARMEMEIRQSDMSSHSEHALAFIAK